MHSLLGVIFGDLLQDKNNYIQHPSNDHLGAIFSPICCFSSRSYAELLGILLKYYCSMIFQTTKFETLVCVILHVADIY